MISENKTRTRTPISRADFARLVTWLNSENHHSATPNEWASRIKESLGFEVSPSNVRNVFGDAGKPGLVTGVRLSKATVSGRKENFLARCLLKVDAGEKLTQAERDALESVARRHKFNV